jgi:scyllo-inositol 2-dehydrogenase (NADP+)
VPNGPFIATNPSFKIVSILRSSSKAPLEGYSSIPVTTSHDEFFANSEVQLVVITTRSNAHVVFVKAALDAGKHVVVEKPFTLTVEEGLELVSLAKSRGLVLAVFHNRRWDGDFLTIEKLVHDANSPLGRVVEYTAHFDSKIYSKDYSLSQYLHNLLDRV